ncbi:hypothetical protein YTPLAS18_16180 [Nitrospira sp.]|nr:hypothetical protein YTPLAS18_16180 [Nitrospira sp.]
MLMWGALIIFIGLVGAIVGYVVTGRTAVGTGPVSILSSFLAALLVMTLLVIGVQYCSQTNNTTVPRTLE